MRRRDQIIALCILAAAVVAIVAGVALATGRNPEVDSGAAGASPPAIAAESSATSAEPSASPSASPSQSASPSPTPSPNPTPSPSPTKPPLRKPTKEHPLRVYFGGDSLAGLPGILFARRGSRTGLMKVRTDYQVSSRLTYPHPINWPARLRAKVNAQHPNVGIFMIGANDPGMPMTVKGRFTMYPQKAWLDEYQHRAETLMLVMLNHGVTRVYWVGLPVMPERNQTNQAKRLNKLFAAAAAKHSKVVYVDAFRLLATEKGGFIASLRSGDGVHFTTEGAWRIANAVWAAMKRDWSPTP
jgi:hypothetical protein